MEKEITFGSEARELLKNGVDTLANAVKITLGAKGRNVVIENHYGQSFVTKDGVTVAKSIFLSDTVENMGAQIIKEVANKTADIAGDGTTTATILAQSIMSNGMKNIAAGANPIDLKRGIDKATSAIVLELKRISQEVGDGNSKIEQVASISANNDKEIGKLIANAVAKVKKDGVITVEESSGIDTYVDFVEGTQIDRGYASPHFVTNQEKMTCEFLNPLILMYSGNVNSMKDVFPILEQAVGTGRPILVISDEIEGEALATLVVNKVRGVINIAAIKSPSFGQDRKDIMEDIATICGGTVISEEKGMKLIDAKIEDLGGAEKITINKETSVVVNGSGDKGKIQERISQLKSQIEIAPNDYEKTRLKQRLARISGGVAVIHVGAISEIEMKEKKDRIDDAVSATRAAIEEGFVAGGGVALIRACQNVTVKTDNEDEKTGASIVFQAAESPIRQIMVNAGLEPSVILNQIKLSDDYGYGFNVKTNTFENMYDAGIIDPTKVTRVALENAASVSGMFLTTEVSVSNKKQANV